MDTKILSFLSMLLIATLIQGASVPEAASSTPSTPGNSPSSRDSVPSTHSTPEMDTFGYRVIRNSNFPCNKKQQLLKKKYRYHPLDDDDKMVILEEKGGKFIKEYMAKNEQGAHDNFPSLLDVDFKFKFKKWKKPKWKLTKAAIDHWMAQEDNEEQNETKQDDMTQPSEHRNATLFKKKVKVDKVFVRPSDIGIPDHTVDEETGEVAKFEHCLTRGTRTPDNTHLYMCTTCTSTTTLGSSYWPPIINEARCIMEDPYCFIADDLPHGLCTHKVIAMQLLKKIEGSCELGLKNGETVIVDDWIAWHRAVHVGCECVINFRSEFAQYVGKFNYYQRP